MALRLRLNVEDMRLDGKRDIAVTPMAISMGTWNAKTINGMRKMPPPKPAKVPNAEKQAEATNNMMSIENFIAYICTGSNIHSGGC